MKSPDPSLPTITRIVCLALNVKHLDRAVHFYTDALGFTVLARNADRARLALGRQAIELVQQTAGRDYPEPRAANDPWFQHFAIAVADMDAAFARLASHPYEPITRGGPWLLPPSTGGVTAYKFRDPDGHPLELSHAPDSDWSRMTPAGDHATLGIDHTALVVPDLEAAVAFYTGLGFRAGARLLNRGPEQAALDGLDDPMVDIAVLLTPEPGPHIELLHYRTPAGSSPVEQNAGDIAATVTVMATATDRLDAPAERTDPGGHRLRLATSVVPAPLH